MKKIISTACLFFTGIYMVNSQQLHTSSFFELQGLLHNPSLAGVQPNNFAGVSYRTQWSGISGSPTTVNAFASFDIPKSGIGLGGYAYMDKTGPTSRSGFDFQLSKHIDMRNGRLALGIDTRVQQYAIDINKLVETLGANDPVLANGNNKYKFDAGFGASFTSQKVQVGVSVSQLVQSKLDFYSGNLSRSAEARLYRHYYAQALYKWQVDEATKIIPHAQLIYLPNAPSEFQGGVRVEHDNLIWWGIQHHVKQSWVLNAGLKLNKKLNLAYSYEIYKTPLSLFEGGSNAHEMMLKYDFKQ